MVPTNVGYQYGDLITKRISSSTPGSRVPSDTTKTVRTRRYSGGIEAVIQYGISEMRGRRRKV
jgi:hypothetical protein